MSRILVVNAGSTSLKLSVVDEHDRTEPVAALTDAPAEVVAVGHRVVHGGDLFCAPVVLDRRTEARLSELVELAPLHNGPSIEAIRVARIALPDRPHVAVFDTAFHATLPPEAAIYALPRRIREGLGVRRYGFHGLSVEWAAERVPVPRLVVCHLGGGCSITAVLDGRSVDTTMGFTPLEGVPMATRSGSIDPGAVLHLLRSGLSVDDVDHLLERESGLLGLSGRSGDVRDLEASTSDEAATALAHFAYRVATSIGAMVVALGGLDALVFTGGVGEHSARVRWAVGRRLSFFGVDVEPDRNRDAEADSEIAAPGSGVRVVVLRAREEIVAARAVRELLARTATV